MHLIFQVMYFQGKMLNQFELFLGRWKRFDGIFLSFSLAPTSMKVFACNDVLVIQIFEMKIFVAIFAIIERTHPCFMIFHMPTKSFQFYCKTQGNNMPT
jgi:hypothetical protein